MTTSDILALIARGLADTHNTKKKEPDVIYEGEGVWRLQGGLVLEEVYQVIQSKIAAHKGDYHMLAGLVLNHLGKIPSVGDQYSDSKISV